MLLRSISLHYSPQKAAHPAGEWITRKYRLPLFLAWKRKHSKVDQGSDLLNVTNITNSVAQDFLKHNFFAIPYLLYYCNIFNDLFLIPEKQGLLTHTLPNAIPTTGKINSFSKIAVTFKPMMQFWYPWRLECPQLMSHSLFYPRRRRNS